MSNCDFIVKCVHLEYTKQEIIVIFPITSNKFLLKNYKTGRRRKKKPEEENIFHQDRCAF